MNYRSFNLEDWIGHISGAIEDETTLDGNEMRDLVEFLSMLKQESEWIPVAKRLPEEDDEYLLFGKICAEDEECYRFLGDYDAGAEAFGFWQERFDSNTLGSLGSEFEEYAEVIAWMPLPAQYKESEEEK